MRWGWHLATVGDQDESNTTFYDMKEVRILHPREADKDDEGQTADILKALGKFQKKQAMREAMVMFARLLPTPCPSSPSPGVSSRLVSRVCGTQLGFARSPHEELVPDAAPPPRRVPRASTE